MFQRGNIYQLVEAIMKEDGLVRSIIAEEQSFMQDPEEAELADEINYKPYQGQRNVIEMCNRIFTGEANPRKWLIKNCD